MLNNLIAVLEPLALTHAIPLVAGAIAVGLLSLILPDDGLTAVAFLLQRGLLLVLLWSRVSAQLLASSAVATLAVGFIYSATTISLYLHRKTRPSPQPRLPTHLPFRVAAAALALLLTSAAVRYFSRTAVPALILWVVAWLLVQSVFSLLLAVSPLNTGLGILTFADAGRIVCSMLRPDPVLWGAWAVCDVLIALGAARLALNDAATIAPQPPSLATSPPAIAEEQQVSSTTEEHTQ